jgi:hypothetical protein
MTHIDIKCEKALEIHNNCGSAYPQMTNLSSGALLREINSLKTAGFAHCPHSYPQK